MIFVAHRINSISELKQIPFSFGVEIDVRDYQKNLVLNHDPYKNGELLEEYLHEFRHKLLVINIKSYGIENDIINLLQNYNINNYFFLDSPMSTIFNFSLKKDGIFCGRYSEFESLETIKLLKNSIKWVWVDTFTKLSLNKENFNILNKELNKKICLTSPDLLGRPDEISKQSFYIKKYNIFPDAICTKFDKFELWNKFLFKY